jgi:hypothetical protein
VETRSFFATGVLELARGSRIQWDGGLIRNSPSSFLDPSGRALVRFKPGLVFDRVNTYVEIEAAAVSAPETPLLVALGLYLRLAMNKVYR